MISNLLSLAKNLGNICKLNNLTLTTAESCTGGLIAEVITSIPGSSAWFDYGFVTYSNLAKQNMLDVQKTTLNQYGAVSRQTAIEMAIGALKHSGAQLSVAVTGIAGPDGGSAEKPVGTVWFAWAKHEKAQTEMRLFTGDRLAIRAQAAEFALTELIKLAANQP